MHNPSADMVAVIPIVAPTFVRGTLKPIFGVGGILAAVAVVALKGFFIGTRRAQAATDTVLAAQAAELSDHRC